MFKLSLRNLLVAHLMGRSLGDYSFGASTGATATGFTLSFATQRRSGSLVAVMGAVARTTVYDSSDVVATRVDDAANGSGLARSAATTATTCPTHVLEHLPKADIVWVIDSSGSMHEEALMVQDNMNLFAQSFASTALDVHVVVMTQSSFVRFPAPLVEPPSTTRSLR